MQGLTDAGISGWKRAVHGSFVGFPGIGAGNPGTFTVVAEADGIAPYIIARSGVTADPLLFP